jgi:Spy/CpxP family protein refolding chaperone
VKDQLEIMSKLAFVKAVVAAGGILFLCAAPELALGQSNQPVTAPGESMKSALAPPGRSAPDLLKGLTLTDDQKAKIDQIRQDTKSRLAAVTSDKKLSPEAANAFLTGYQRNENAKILEVLTPEQQQQVRKRLAAWKAAAAGGKPQYPLRPVAGSGQTPKPPQ